MQDLVALADVFGALGTGAKPPPPPQPPAAAEGGKLAALGSSKRVTWTARVAGKADLEEEDGEAEELVDEYMGLPTEEWAVLDPAYVERSVDEPGCFVVRVELGKVLEAVVGGSWAELKPEIAVRAETDTARRTVTLEGRKGRLGVGEVEEYFAAELDAEMRWERGPPRVRCEAKVAGTVKVVGPLAKVPRAVTGAAASLVARLAMGYLLPRFLQLLADDFKRYVAGGGERDVDASVGSLVPPQQEPRVPPDRPPQEA